MARHTLSAIFSSTHGSVICTHIFSGRNAGSCLVFSPRLFFLSLQAGQLRHYFCLPPFNFYQSLLRPRPSFTSKRENGVHVIHQSLTFNSPRNILALVYLDVLPKGLGCRLHSFFHSVARLPLMIHHRSQYLEEPCEVPRIISSFSSDAYGARPPQACRLGLQIHFRRFFNEVFQHLLQVVFRVKYDPKSCQPTETAHFDALLLLLLQYLCLHLTWPGTQTSQCRCGVAQVLCLQDGKVRQELVDVGVSEVVVGSGLGEWKDR